MAPLLLELTPLEVEALDIVTSETEQQGSLDTLTTMQYDVAALLTRNGNLSVNSDDDGVPVLCCGIFACCIG